MKSALCHDIRRLVLHWYEHNKRDLPWRQTRDPYAIWISETMLQQTQVTTVVPYYRRFIRAFPTVRALDRASRDRVMALWSGLGYYRRAENLKKAARIIVSQYKGKMPQQFGALRDLPGIGDYTAGAVTSIAFGQAYPALDANARRVLKRIFRVPEGKALKQLSTTLVPHSRPGDFNQGLMDLGAEICSTQKPDCPACPCKRLCRTRRYGPAEGNKLQRQAPRVEIVWPLAVITRKGMILLHRRPEKGLLAGLWELPGGRLFRGESPRVALARQLNDIGGIPGVMRVDREVRHSIMHYKIRAPVFVSSSGAVAIAPRGKRWRWVPLTSVGTYPMSSLSRKAIRLAVRPSHTTGASTVSGAATDTR